LSSGVHTAHRYSTPSPHWQQHSPRRTTRPRIPHRSFTAIIHSSYLTC